MQILLTQEEFDELKQEGEDARNAVVVLIQRLCTEVANHKPVAIHWGGGEPPEGTRKEPWGCRRSSDLEDATCDLCPVREDCPDPYKAYSK